MAKTKFKANLQKLSRLSRRVREIRSGITQGIAKQLGRAVIQEMKDGISKGVSPIRGNRRFKAYRGSYKKRIREGKLKGKKLRPVNLYLSGAFLKNLKFRTKPVFVRGFKWHATEIGFYDRKSQLKEQGHREGANKQEKRPIIPEGNERFNARITRIINKIYRERIRKILRRR